MYTGHDSVTNSSRLGEGPRKATLEGGAHPWTTDNEGLVFKGSRDRRSLSDKGTACTKPQQLEEAVDGRQVTREQGVPSSQVCIFF